MLLLGRYGFAALIAVDNHLFVDSDGDVGIGTTDPGYKIDIESTLGSDFTTVQTFSRTDSTNGGGSAILFKSSSSDTIDRYGVKLGAVRSVAGNGAAEFVIQLEKSSASSNQIKFSNQIKISIFFWPLTRLILILRNPEKSMNFSFQSSI